MTGAEYAYVQARLQARHGGMPGPASWTVPEASHTAAHYLARARAGALSAWVDGQDPSGDAHRAERQLRLRWQRYVDDLAAWQPLCWRPATRWFASLPELALIKPPADDDAVARWLQAWLDLVPAGEALGVRLPALLRRVATLLMPGMVGADGGRHHRAAAQSAQFARSAQAEPVRRALQRLFRRHAATPVAVFAHLALVALDVERLRGGLVVRTLYEPAHVQQGVPQGAPQGA